MEEEKQDNARIEKPIIVEKVKITPEQIRKRLEQYIKDNPDRIYSATKARYYQNLQNFYNHNAFGFGINGNQTNYDYTTPGGQSKIQATYDYSKNNAQDFLTNVAMVGAAPVFNTVGKVYTKALGSPFVKTGGNLGRLNTYTANGILGEGAEAIVIKNTPTTVAKISAIPVNEITARNAVPNVVKSKYIGFVKDGKIKLPTYIQDKVKVLTEETFPKYANKLDKAMERSGFRRVNDPNVQYRAYTNGQVVVDDIAPSNVGLTSGNSYLDIILPNFLKKPQIIDMAYQTVSEWTSQGFTLKRGGKL